VYLVEWFPEIQTYFTVGNFFEARWVPRQSRASFRPLYSTVNFLQCLDILFEWCPHQATFAVPRCESSRYSTCRLQTCTPKKQVKQRDKVQCTRWSDYSFTTFYTLFHVDINTLQILEVNIFISCVAPFGAQARAAKH